MEIQLNSAPVQEIVENAKRDKKPIQIVGKNGEPYLFIPQGILPGSLVLGEFFFTDNGEPLKPGETAMLSNIRKEPKITLQNKD